MSHLPLSKEADLAVDSSQGEVENVATSVAVDKRTERKLMAKLDRRIVPMVMWMCVSPESSLVRRQAHNMTVIS